jgi:glutathione S-transferase
MVLGLLHVFSSVSDFPWEDVPVLQVDGGTKLGQQMAILRYLGKTYDLAGENDFESAQCDEIVESLQVFDLGYQLLLYNT